MALDLGFLKESERVREKVLCLDSQMEFERVRETVLGLDF